MEKPKKKTHGREREKRGREREKETDRESWRSGKTDKARQRERQRQRPLCQWLWICFLAGAVVSGVLPTSHGHLLLFHWRSSCWASSNAFCNKSMVSVNDGILRTLMTSTLLTEWLSSWPISIVTVLSVTFWLWWFYLILTVTEWPLSSSFSLSSMSIVTITSVADWLWWFYLVLTVTDDHHSHHPHQCS